MSKRKRIYSKRSEKQANAAYKSYQIGCVLNDLHAVSRLEESLRNDHWDIITRCKLLGFYSGASRPNTQALWCEHAEWLIKNCPDEKLMTYVLQIPEGISEEQYEALKDSFLQKVKRNPKNANVVGHAAEFVGQRDSERSLALYKRAKKLAPNDERWARTLFMRSVINARAKEDKELAKIAYRKGIKFVRKFENFPNEAYAVMVVLQELCELALEFDHLDMAERLVREIKHSYWNAISPDKQHHYEGLLALKHGRIKRAKAELLMAAKRGQDPDSCDLKLARQLQERGEIDAVAQYLTLCLRNMSADYQKEEIKLVKQWITRLNKGQAVELEFPN